MGWLLVGGHCFSRICICDKRLEKLHHGDWSSWNSFGIWMVVSKTCHMKAVLYKKNPRVASKYTAFFLIFDRPDIRSFYFSTVLSQSPSVGF